jgi:hypothetical protein
MAQGWSHGPVGAVIAAWPAVSLVGSYELLVWIIRTATAGDLGRVPAADHRERPADHPGTKLLLAAAQEPEIGPGTLQERGIGLVPDVDGPPPLAQVAGAGQQSGPGWNMANQADQMADHTPGFPGLVGTERMASDVNAAAVAAYRASVQIGKPLSERKLAGKFGKTSRRWARSRMAEARQNLVSA